MGNDDWVGAAQEYLRRVGAAEHEAWRKRKNPRKSDKFSPSEYLRDMCDLLGKGDEEAFKARKMLNGRDSAAGV